MGFLSTKRYAMPSRKRRPAAEDPVMGDDSVPLPPARPAAKKTASASGSRGRSRAVDPDPDSDDSEEGDGAFPPRSRRMNPAERQKAELEAVMRSKRTGEPKYPFPPELDDRFKPYWREMVDARPHDYFSIEDAPLMKMYCRAAWEVDVLTKEIDDEGHVVLNAKMNPTVNPRVFVRNLVEGRLLALATKLRLQPASRYSSENDKNQGAKAKKAGEAADAIEDDDEDLLAGTDGGVASRVTGTQTRQ